MKIYAYRSVQMMKFIVYVEDVMTTKSMEVAVVIVLHALMEKKQWTYVIINQEERDEAIN